MSAPYKQKMWAVSDPFWGEPYLLPETFRESGPAAVKAFLTNVAWGISHGGSDYPLPDGRPGDWDRALANGFYLVRIEIDGSGINILKEST